ncbi:hypothetical protein FRC05_007627 [Tulasnella sp. 425]|nr:hypothetical protein FRC05_007627 [Tulasnella sp. 425]
MEQSIAPSLLALSILAGSLASVFAEPSDNDYIGNNGHWTPKFAATAWKASRRGSDNNGVHVFFTGSNGCSGIQLATLSIDHDGHGNNHHGRANPGLENQGNNNQNQNGQVQENTFGISETQDNRGGNNNNVNVNTANVNNYNSQISFWTKAYCFSNSGHNSWRINTHATFAVTSIGGSNDVTDMRLFYWSTTGRGNTAVLKDAYYTRSGRGKRGSNQNQNMDSGHWKSGKLSRTVSRANLGSLAATSWTKAGKVGRTVFYVQGILHKRVYIRNTATNQVIEYTWSDATPYTTTVNNLYATSFIETGAGSSAASLQVSRGKPNLYL